MSEHADFELNIDLTEVNAWGGESGPVIPPGVYDLEIVSVEQGQSTRQQPVIKVEFSVLNEGQFFGKSFIKSYSLQQQSLGRVKALLMACGARLDGIRGSELLNRQIVGEYVHRQGDPQPNADGSMSEGKMFGDLLNERAPEGAEPAKAEPAKTAAAATAATNAKGAAVRRAVGQVQKPAS